ncbi:hypothetical protein EDD52_11446 [Primorskyibacter sedentarius]|uniref:MotA/TolQ/ExbB proton channel family protein n=1 Tax=Primorskyibacter sedentarius TaxID=745311 RepID=A0A4R3J3Q3_9RHOB|nr:biopolymer transporter ExbB [Primorskyibacter sedentarius]TCS60448.1 hypothetical protein EDD52_11446 [Primorskyibacter sedentarius]
MEQPDLEAQAHFSQPVRQVILMLLVLVLTGAGAFLALPRVLPVFQSNPYLNGFILFVFGLGVLACFWQVGQLINSVRWIEEFVTERETRKAPLLLAPLATLLRMRGRRMQITTTSTRSILDSVATRIDEAREITRYIVSLLIFLGLLGTFYGLATTVPALVDTIRSLAPQENEAGVEVFSRLMSGLEAQLGGMGVAFASSLLGLAGSLVVGLLELFAGHGQNRFYRELEEWLSSITRLGFTAGESEHGGEPSGGAYALDQVADHLQTMQELMAASQEGQQDTEDKLAKLVDAVERMSSKVETSSPAAGALLRVAEGQERLVETLHAQGVSEGLDAESRMRLRSIDVQMLRILEEIAAGRQESMQELRTDLASIGRTLQQLVPPSRAQRRARFRPTEPLPKTHPDEGES